MSEGAFHSPYQFIPVQRRSGKAFDLKSGEPASADDGRDVGRRLFTDIAAGRTAATQDHYGPELHSGRVLCSLSVESPLLVGAGRKPPGDGDESITTMENYRYRGELAVPGNSLRGAVGALMEALSQSAMRVLADQTYDVRKSMGHSLKAIGLVIKQRDGTWQLRPLALTGIMVGDEKFADKWLRVFSPDSKLGDCLTTYFGDYGGRTGESPSDYRCFQLATQPEYRAIDGEPPELYQLTLGEALRRGVGSIQGFKPRGALHYRAAIAHTPPLLSQVCEHAHPGVLYVLGHHPEMPRKFHEWFVPFRADDHGHPLTRQLQVEESAIEQFEFLCAGSLSREDNKQLFIPRGYGDRRPPHAPQDHGTPGVLHSGDLVYFNVDDPKNADQAPKVTEISWSAIWRKRVDGTLYRAFAPGYDSDDPSDDGELLPWGIGKRRHLTAAEVALGVVEDGGKPGRNLASRIRFADALPQGTIALQPRVPLRPLSSPKPPAPSMYFRAPGGAYIPKERLDLSGADDHEPNGRKLYLHHRPQDWKATPQWRTGNLEGHADPAHAADPRDAAKYSELGGLWGRPIEPGAVFLFHVDFHNLTDAELHLLRAALDPVACPLNPGHDRLFQHKIGWGKPLGLGSVQISRVAELYVDRGARYRADAILGDDEPRYTEVWVGNPELARALPQRYALERECIDLGQEIEPRGSDATSLIDAKTLATVLAIGNPQNVRCPVTYPVSAFADQEPGNEDEGFKWFVENANAHSETHPDSSRAEMLGDVRPGETTALPALHDHHGMLSLPLDDSDQDDKALSDMIRKSIQQQWRKLIHDEPPPHLWVNILHAHGPGCIALIDVSPPSKAQTLLELDAMRPIRRRTAQEQAAFKDQRRRRYRQG